MLEFLDNFNNGLPPIPESEITEADVIQEIFEIKNKFKNEIIILAHHYQQDEIIQFADFSGDSLELAKKIKDFPNIKYIVFCGVYFMAETAYMLSKNNQNVILPDLEAGCFLADTAKIQDVENAYSYFKESTNKKIIPITYINSSADIKAFVGNNGGAICTSSNASKIIKWALENGEKLFFLPDQHLGRNTCFQMGIPLNEMVLYEQDKINGGLTSDQIDSSKILLWHGYCSVHQGFNVNQIKNIRKKHPNIKIIVHPECSFDVVQNADLSGSTSNIIKFVESSNSGSHIAIGTEINLVNRLAKKYSDKFIHSLSEFQCLCTTMYRIRPRWLLDVLRSIKNNKPKNIITVDNATKEASLKALQKMMEIL